jgi:hypothetical protein
MSLNVNVHHAQVQPGELGVYRNSAGDLIVSLNSTGSYGGTVTLFLTDQEWDAIAGTVQAFRESEQRDSADRAYAEWVHETDVLDTEQFSTIAVCEECGDTDVLGSLNRGLCYPCDRRESSID